MERIIPLYKEMRIMRVKDWDFNNKSLVVDAQNGAGYRFTSAGLRKYWTAVDSALQYCDVGKSGKKPTFFKKYKNNNWNKKQRRGPLPQPPY